MMLHRCCPFLVLTWLVDHYSRTVQLSDQPFQVLEKHAVLYSTNLTKFGQSPTGATP